LLKPVIAEELQGSETDFFPIVTAFTAAYAVGLLQAGRLLDRVGVR